MSRKKSGSYEKPVITEHGSVEEITQTSRNKGGAGVDADGGTIIIGSDSFS